MTSVWKFNGNFSRYTCLGKVFQQMCHESSPQHNNNILTPIRITLVDRV